MPSISIEIRGFWSKYFEILGILIKIPGFSFEILGTSKTCDNCIPYAKHLHELNNNLRTWWFIDWCRIRNHSKYCHKGVVVKCKCLKMWTVVHERSCILINKNISFHCYFPCYLTIQYRI